MSYGLPIITTNKCLAGVELIENGKNGYIIPEENSIELAKYINILIRNNVLRKSMGDNNKRKIQNYTIENMAKCHADFFNKYQL